MVRRDVALRKVARAVSWLDDAEAIFSVAEEDLAEDIRTRDVGTFYLFLAIQESIDLAAHYVADEGWSPPDDAGATFDVLAEHAIITPEVADAMRRATGLRNRIAHGYAALDHPRLQREAKEGMGHLRSFLDAVAAAAGL